MRTRTASTRPRLLSGSGLCKKSALLAGRVGRRVADRIRDSPSPRRTGRADFPHPALLKPWSQAHALDLRGLEPNSPEVLVIRSCLRQTKGSLTAPVQVSEQTLADMPVDLPRRVPRISKPEVVPPTFQLPIQPFNQFRDRLMTLMTIRHLRQLVPFPLQRFLRNLILSSGAIKHIERLMFDARCENSLLHSRGKGDFAEYGRVFMNRALRGRAETISHLMERGYSSILVRPWLG